MRKMFLSFLAMVAIAFTSLPANAGSHSGGWMLDGAASNIAFGSVKKGTVGESHHFESLSGSVDADGMVTVEIDLTSVETWIDVRNERMVEHVFGDAVTATLGAQLDISQLMAMDVGGLSEVEVKGTLSLGEASVPIEVWVIVARLSDTRVMVVTSEMVFVSIADLGVDAGISMLQELAKLPDITRTSPVTFRLVFDQNM